MTENKADTTIWERIQEVVKDSTLTDQDFASSVNIDRSQFGRILKGKINVTLKQLMEISSLYGVRMGWLTEGEGEKNKSGVEPDQNLIGDIVKEMDVMRASLDRMFEKLPKRLVPGKPVGRLGSRQMASDEDKKKIDRKQEGK